MNDRALRSGFLALALAGITGVVTAQRDIIVPPPRPIPVPRPVPVQIRATDLKVAVSVQDGIATTDLRQTVHNDGSGLGEATWILPLPRGATADHFTMTVGGKEVPGEVLDPQKARTIYESIVRKRRDPGLLEYMGDGCLRARVFPIPPKGSIEVRVRYRQVLPQTAGLHSYEFPLRAAGLPGKPPDKLSLDLTIRSHKPIKNVYSPVAGIDIVRKGDHEARASLELQNGKYPERDLAVFYGVSTDAVGMDLLSWRKEGDAGHFLLMISPKHDWPEPKNTIRVVQFVVDTSGSMQGKKIEQARNALRFFVKSLRPADRFNVVPFATEARPFFTAPAEVNETSVERAMKLIGEIEARGGTNIEDAMKAALSAEMPNPDVPANIVPIVVFLTDGQPTVGLTKVEELLGQIRQNNPNKARVFVFGVGDDVNTHLLDKMAAETNGDRDYVRENENLEVKTGALFTKLSNPVLTDIALAFDGIEVTDVFPKKLPDMFKGSRLLVLGRYTGDGHHAVRLKGKVDGSDKEFVYEAAFPQQSGEHDFIGTLWAQRKVAVLLDAIRLNGQSTELVNEIQRLGREYGIVTPYTSHLILEEGMQIAQFRGIRPQAGAPGGEAFALGFGVANDDRVRHELERAGAIADGERRSLRGRLGDVTEEAKKAADLLARLPKTKTGRDAVDQSVMLQTLLSTAAPPAADPSIGGGGRGWNGVGLITRRIQGRTFYLAGGAWIDRDYTQAMRGKERKIEAFSDEYFEILREHPELAKVFAFSTRIVVVIDGVAFEIA